MLRVGGAFELEFGFPGKYSWFCYVPSPMNCVTHGGSCFLCYDRKLAAWVAFLDIVRGYFICLSLLTTVICVIYGDYSSGDI